MKKSDYCKDVYSMLALERHKQPNGETENIHYTVGQIKQMNVQLIWGQAVLSSTQTVCQQRTEHCNSELQTFVYPEHTFRH